MKKVNGSDDGEDDKSALLSDYKYDNTTSKECNDIMKGMERSPVTGKNEYFIGKNFTNNWIHLSYIDIYGI